MENDTMKKCPFCAEMIKAEAVKCRYCNSDLRNRGFNMDFLTTPGYWQRVNEGKKIAGVCTGIAHQLNSPILIMPLRLFFIVTTIFYAFGFILYIILWLLMPAPTDAPGAAGSMKFANSSIPGKGEPEKTEEAKEEKVSGDAITITDENGKQPPETAETPDEQEKSESGAVSERRMMKPLLVAGMFILCVFIVLRGYMAAMESLMDVTIPSVVVFFGFISVMSIMAVMVRELVNERQFAMVSEA